MKTLIKSAALILSALALTNCGSGTANLSKGEPPQDSTGIIQEYKIGAADQLTVHVWKNPELSGNAVVRPDGKISIPLVGDMGAAGYSAKQLAENITVELKKLIRNPQVTVIITNPTSADYLHRIRITGAVANPQSIGYRKGVTVLDVVLDAGGLTPFASANNGKLFRQTADGIKVYPLKIKDILEKGDLRTNYDLYPQDIITIPERAF